MNRLAFLLLPACSSFADPSVVIDLRVIAMTATPPEQVIDLDLENPPTIGDLAEQLQPAAVCATVADPGRAATLRWSMTACATDNARCDPARPQFEIGHGGIPDPEVAGAPFCAPVVPSADLIGLLVDAYDNDPVHGLAGLSYTIELRVGTVDGNPDDDQFAAKTLKVTPRLPGDRIANHNPTLDQLQYQTPDLQLAVLAPCSDELPRPQITANSLIAVVPVERADTREPYAAATIDGTFEMFTESITYQWLATAGSFGDETTGGTTDLLGNVPSLSTKWHAPAKAQEVQLWMIQRDERGGVSVYPSCLDVISGR